MFRCYSYTIIRERFNSCLLKLQLLQQSIKIRKIHISHTPMYLNFPHIRTVQHLDIIKVLFIHQLMTRELS